MLHWSSLKRCHEIKRCLLTGRKAMTNIDSILKSRDITLPTNVHIIKATGFSSSHVWMWELDYKESWAPKNWCFWTVVLEKTAELTHWKRPWCWERLKAGGEGDDRGWDGGMASPTWQTGVWVSSWSWWWTEKPGMQKSMGSQRIRHDWVNELNWTELIKFKSDSFKVIQLAFVVT